MTALGYSVCFALSVRLFSVFTLKALFSCTIQVWREAHAQKKGGVDVLHSRRYDWKNREWDHEYRMHSMNWFQQSFRRFNACRHSNFMNEKLRHLLPSPRVGGAPNLLPCALIKLTNPAFEFMRRKLTVVSPDRKFSRFSAAQLSSARGTCQEELPQSGRTPTLTYTNLPNSHTGKTKVAPAWKSSRSRFYAGAPLHHIWISRPQYI